jgi:hypothetical protein
MKRFNFIPGIIILFSIFSFAIKAQDNMLFELNSSALFDNSPTDNYSILVYEGGQLKDSIFIKKTKPKKISLEGEKLYSLVFKKDNYPSKVVIINTEVPKGVGELIEEPFDLQIELSPKVSKIKNTYDDYPVAILMVSKKKKLLMASENYYQLTHN